MIISDNFASFLKKRTGLHSSRSANFKNNGQFSEQPPVWCVHCGSAWLARSIAPNQSQSSHFETLIRR
jgi:hypothetical protein